MTGFRICIALGTTLALASCASAPNYCYVSDQVQYQRTELRASVAPPPSRDFAAPRSVAFTPASVRSPLAEDPPAPNVGSPEWERQQAIAAQKDKELDTRIRNICRGC